MKSRVQICLNCSKEFSRKRSLQKYCSLACFSAELRYARAAKQRKLREGRENRICRYCARKFTAEHGSRKYCSDDCSYSAKLKAGRTKAAKARKNKMREASSKKVGDSAAKASKKRSAVYAIEGIRFREWTGSGKDPKVSIVWINLF